MPDEDSREHTGRGRRQEFADAFVTVTQGERQGPPVGRRAIVITAAVVAVAGACIAGGAILASAHTRARPRAAAAAATERASPPKNGASPASVSRSRPATGMRPPAAPPPAGQGVLPAAPVPPAAAPVAALAPSRPAQRSGPFRISGTVSCISGHAVVGVYVAAAKGSGFSPWRGQGNGSVASFWYTLPSRESYSLHVGCGGNPSAWQVATYSGTVSASVSHFACDDVPGRAGYGSCRTT